MPHLVTAYDHENMDAARERVRQAHRDYLASLRTRLLASGALLDEHGRIVGGASLIDTDDRDEAVRFEQDAPYARAGIRREVRIDRWRLRWWIGAFDADGHRPSGAS